MGDSYDRLAAARQDLRLLVGDLNSVSGELEELATMWRRQCRAANSWLDHPPGFPQDLRDAAGRLISTVQALAEAGPGETSELASSAVAQLSALDSDIAAAAAIMSSSGPASDAPAAGAGVGAQAWATVSRTLSDAEMRLRSLISHLLKIRECSLSGLADGRSGSVT
jgi:hypothetical protein